MIVFEKIRWRNFLSTGQYWTEVALDKTQTTLITGENGAGKSTMLDALCFGLYGKPYRNINIPQLVNSINLKDTMVEVEFKIDSNRYRVRRGLSPKVFEVFKNGDLIDQEAASRDYQRLFEETVLKMNFKAFCQISILGSANYTPFMRLTAADRRSIVEAILDINIFSTMNTLLKGKIAKAKEDLTDIEGQLIVAKQKITLHQRYLEERSKDTKGREQEYIDSMKESESAIQVLTGEVSSIREKIGNLLSSTEERDNTTKAITDMAVIHRQLRSKIKSVAIDLEFYETNDTCPTCSQKIDESFREDTLSAKRKKVESLQEAIVEIEKSVDIAQSRMASIEETMREIRELETQAVEKETSIRGLMRSVDKTRRSLEDLSKQSDEDASKNTAELDTLKGEADEMGREREILIDDQFHYGIAANLLKDSGIKGRIIKHYIPIINRTINRYLSQMSLFVNFTLDEEFNETLKSRHRDTFTYASFSEGEKKKIDLALLFAWRTIASMKNSVSTNLLIMDEILDGSLDDTAVEAFLDILKGFDRTVNVFVISHKPKELLESKFERHMQFVKRNNFSRTV